MLHVENKIKVNFSGARFEITHSSLEQVELVHVTEQKRSFASALCFTSNLLCKCRESCARMAATNVFTKKLRSQWNSRFRGSSNCFLCCAAATNSPTAGRTRKWSDGSSLTSPPGSEQTQTNTGRALKVIFSYFSVVFFFPACPRVELCRWLFYQPASKGRAPSTLLLPAPRPVCKAAFL